MMNASCRNIQPLLLLHIESERSGCLELNEEEFQVVSAHLELCDVCRAEKTAIEKNVDLISTVSTPEPSSSLASRCLPQSSTQRNSIGWLKWQTVSGGLIILVVFGLGYLVRGLENKHPLHDLEIEQAAAMSVLFEQQDGLINKLEQRIRQNETMPDSFHGVSVAGLRQSVHLVRYLYQDISPDVVISENIRHITEQNIQLLKSLNQYLEDLDQTAVLPVREI